MRKIVYVLVALILVVSCNKKAEVKMNTTSSTYVKFGDTISPDSAITKEALLLKYLSFKYLSSSHCE